MIPRGGGRYDPPMRPHVTDNDADTLGNVPVLVPEVPPALPPADADGATNGHSATHQVSVHHLNVSGTSEGPAQTVLQGLLATTSVDPGGSEFAVHATMERQALSDGTACIPHWQDEKASRL